MNNFKHWLFHGKYRRCVLLAFDFICFAVINVVYYFLAAKSEHGITFNSGLAYLYNSISLMVCIFLSRIVFKNYNNVWRYTNTSAYMINVCADFIGGSISILLSYFVLSNVIEGFYIGIWHGVTVTALTTLITLTSRFGYRLVYKHFNMSDKRVGVNVSKVNVAIIGAGQVGANLVAELLNSNTACYEPKCFIDVDMSKVGKRIANVPVYTYEDAESVIYKYNVAEVIFAIPSMSREKTEELWKFYSGFGCKVKIYDQPLHHEQMLEDKKRMVIREFAIEDLLFRQPLDISKDQEFDYYTGKTVLVTGGGGSIGSELCRQIAKCKPKKLIIFDIYENNAYDIEQELKRKYSDKLDFIVEIGSVRDEDRLECVFKNYRPQLVFHAAAHKHVPLMQHSSGEAIKNNVMGTYNTANMAEKYGVEKFILISTDKAVNPTNVMGASKRLCEMVVQCRIDSKTSFAAVRFGNVLGSNGSVIPLFKRQIAAGGPITITDKRIIRYFMTIPEASQLVMLAGAKAKNGELFVLDMGQPVKIYDLAVNMIKLMGYVVDKDIEIKEIGLRPGEKLYEELLMKNETLVKTDNKSIFIERDKPFTREQVNGKIKILMDAVEQSKYLVGSDIVKQAIKQTVPTFIEPEEVNERAEYTEYFKKSKEQRKAE